MLIKYIFYKNFATAVAVFLIKKFPFLAEWEFLYFKMKLRFVL